MWVSIDRDQEPGVARRIDAFSFTSIDKHCAVRPVATFRHEEAVSSSFLVV